MLRCPPIYLLASLLGLAVFANCGAQEPKSNASGKVKVEPRKEIDKATAAGDKGAAKVDADLPEYKPAKGVSGAIRSVGSDTMNNLMNAWCEGFEKHYPNVSFAVEGKGSSTAMPALESGSATFGPMSRSLKQEEISNFEKRFGYKPVQLPTSIDVLGVFVHKDNPIKGLSLEQVDAIFSTTRKLGAKAEITTWGQLGLTGDWAKAPISLYGRNTASGTYGYFKEHALGNGDFRDDVKVQPGSSGVVDAVANEKFAIAYSGIGFATPNVRAVPLAKKEGGEFVPAEAQYAYNQKYPLARPLFLTVNYDETKPLDPLRREFLRYVFCKEGQADVLKQGYLPLPAKAAKSALTKVGIK